MGKTNQYCKKNHSDNDCYSSPIPIYYSYMNYRSYMNKQMYYKSVKMGRENNEAFLERAQIVVGGDGHSGPGGRNYGHFGNYGYYSPSYYYGGSYEVSPLYSYFTPPLPPILLSPPQPSPPPYYPWYLFYPKLY